MTVVWSEDDVAVAVRQLMERAAATFTSISRLPPMAWLFATKNPDTGAPSKHLMSVPPMGEVGVKQRRTFPLLIRLAALRGGAVGLVFVARATARTRGGAEQEVLMVLAEHKTLGVRVWRAEITRTPAGAVMVGNWERESGDTESRFLKLLPSDDTAGVGPEDGGTSADGHDGRDGHGRAAGAGSRAGSAPGKVSQGVLQPGRLRSVPRGSGE